MSEVEFDRLIKGYLEGTLSSGEKELVDKWLASMESKETLVEWPAEDRARVRSKLMQQISSRKSESGHIVGYVRMIQSSAWLRAAAAILLPFILGYFIWESRILESASDREEVAYKQEILPDGTIVWLKGSESRINYPKQFTGENRVVQFTGEALMEVAKDPKHPFIIQCDRNGAFARVLGTSFNVKSSEEAVEVAVLTGKVSLMSPDQEQEVTIIPREKAVYNALQEQIVHTAFNDEERISLIFGTNYNMRFPDAKMREIIPRIQSKFKVQVTLSDKDILNCRLTADFTDQSLERTLSMISQALGIKWKLQDSGKDVYLEGVGCE